MSGSGVSESSRTSRPVPKSAVVQGSVKSASDKRKNRRQAASAASQRVSIRPPVCDVHPGRVLELRTNLGLMKARALLDQTLQHTQPSDLAGADSLTKAENMKGQLKTGRLQPLGIVNDEMFEADDCLGVVPVSSKREKYDKRTRPRSSTVPGVQFDLPDESDRHGQRPRERVRGNVKARQRSYSAVLSRSLDTSQIVQLLSVSRQTGLVPSGIVHQGTPPEGETQQRDTRDEVTGGNEERGKEKIQFLPPVVTQGELRLKVEVKRLTKTDASDTSSPEMTSKVASPPTGSPVNPSSGQNSPKTPILPPLVGPQIYPLSISPQKITPEQQTNRRGSHSRSRKSPRGQSVDERGRKEKGREGSGSDGGDGGGGSEIGAGGGGGEGGGGVEGKEGKEEERSPLKVSIVALGEAEAGLRARSGRRKRQSSGNQSGRLSLGWSAPQPITAPLKGTPLYPPPGNESRGSPEKAPVINGHQSGTQSAQIDSSDLERALSPNMLNVDVSQVLIEAQQADS